MYLNARLFILNILSSHWISTFNVQYFYFIPTPNKLHSKEFELQLFFFFPQHSSPYLLSHPFVSFFVCSFFSWNTDQNVRACFCSSGPTWSQRQQVGKLKPHLFTARSALPHIQNGFGVWCVKPLILSGVYSEYGSRLGGTRQPVPVALRGEECCY